MTIQEMMTKENCNEDGVYHLLATKMIDRLKENTKKKSIKLILHEGESDVLASKIGGVPFIPRNGQYPVNSLTGDKLYFLIQLNFGVIPHLESYPTSGILQIFIGGDDLYGMNYQDARCQDSWRIIYHEDISDPMPMEEVKKLLPEVTCDTLLPFMSNDQEFKLEFQEMMMPITFDDFHFDEIAFSLWKDILPEEWKNITKSTQLPDDIYDKLYDTFLGEGSRLGGYPYFSQFDPRGYGNEIENYELLLQIDSERDEEGYCFMWGDAGVGNFFIDPEDLKKCDFSKVVYNWDCG